MKMNLTMKQSVRWFPFILLLFCLQGPARAQLEIPESIRPQMQEGVEALERGNDARDIRTALRAFLSAAMKEPRFPDVHYYLARTYSLLPSGLSNSVQELRLYLELYPGAPDAEEVKREIERLDSLSRIKWRSDLLGCQFAKTKKGIFVSQIESSSEAVIMGLRPGYQIIKVGKTEIPPSLSLQDFYTLLDNYPDSSFILTARYGKTDLLIAWKRRFRPPTPDIYDLGEESLRRILDTSRKPVFAAFWNPWCDSCRQYEKLLKEWSGQYKDSVLFVSIRTDQAEFTARDFGVTGIPVSQFYVRGKAEWTQEGLNQVAVMTKLMRYKRYQQLPRQRRE